MHSINVNLKNLNNYTTDTMYRTYLIIEIRAVMKILCYLSRIPWYVLVLYVFLLLLSEYWILYNLCICISPKVRNARRKIILLTVCFDINSPNVKCLFSKQDYAIIERALIRLATVSKHIIRRPHQETWLFQNGLRIISMLIS